jgi:hypothetical protein
MMLRYAEPENRPTAGQPALAYGSKTLASSNKRDTKNSPTSGHQASEDTSAAIRSHDAVGVKEVLRVLGTAPPVRPLAYACCYAGIGHAARRSRYNSFGSAIAATCSTAGSESVLWLIAVIGSRRCPGYWWQVPARRWASARRGAVRPARRRQASQLVAQRFVSRLKTYCDSVRLSDGVCAVSVHKTMLSSK